MLWICRLISRSSTFLLDTGAYVLGTIVHQNCRLIQQSQIHQLISHRGGWQSQILSLFGSQQLMWAVPPTIKPSFPWCVDPPLCKSPVFTFTGHCLSPRWFRDLEPWVLILGNHGPVSSIDHPICSYLLSHVFLPKYVCQLRLQKYAEHNQCLAHRYSRPLYVSHIPSFYSTQIPNCLNWGPLYT